MSEESSGGRSRANAPRLLDQVREAIRWKYFSRHTEQAYVHWIRRFIYFHGKRHPRDLGEAEVTAFLNDLSVERKVAAGTQNQALSALLFMYKEVLGRELAGSTACNGPSARLACLSFSRVPQSSVGRPCVT